MLPSRETVLQEGDVLHLVLREEDADESEYEEVGSAQHSSMAGFDMTDGVAAQAIAQHAARGPQKPTSDAAKQTGGGSSKRKSSRRR